MWGRWFLTNAHDYKRVKKSKIKIPKSQLSDRSIVWHSEIVNVFCMKWPLLGWFLNCSLFAMINCRQQISRYVKSLRSKSTLRKFTFMEVKKLSKLWIWISFSSDIFVCKQLKTFSNQPRAQSNQFSIIDCLVCNQILNKCYFLMIQMWLLRISSILHISIQNPQIMSEQNKIEAESWSFQ